ncbi:MAG: hypothetical protein EDR02_05915 [Actinobacteria bacterium]|nr:MAG: hypothetical protein EDR02_05915 [Actinomycetota bacterium]RIK08176.1 MAG: hypothetical protein DCC48_02035 [Acidobacteriota bacterium]
MTRERDTSDPSFVVLAGVLLAFGLLTSCATSTAEFTSGSFEEIEAALEVDGLEICGTTDVVWDDVGGVVAGRQYQLSSDSCADLRRNENELQVQEFDDVGDRDGALFNAMSYMTRGARFANGQLWTWGPFLLELSGPVGDDVSYRVNSALESIGAVP